MKKAASLFTTVLALGVISFAPRAWAQSPGGQQEGPREIDKCQTIDKPGSYKLINNLIASTTADCLIITADFVTIDLAGFSINVSVQPFGGTAIQAGPSSGSLTGVAVRNGSISNFFKGVDLSAAGDSVVEGIRIVGIGVPLGAFGIDANGIVKGNVVTSYGRGNGILASGIVTGNYVASNMEGIGVGPGSTVIGNTATDNFAIGITVSCPSNVTDNTAVGSATNLILNGDGCNNTNNVAP